MSYYKGSKCPYCNREFTETDDIVVCPECGTPHHRECYREHGKCANDTRHNEGFSWLPEGGTVNEKVGCGTDSAQQCPRCGCVNYDNATVCQQCGAPLAGNYGNVPSNPSPFVAQPSNDEGRYLNSSETLDNHPVKDWAMFISKNVGYYLYTFKSQDVRHSKFAFTWSALLFAPIYFLYRKVWWAGIAALVSNILFNMPSTVLMFLTTNSEFLGLDYAAWYSIATFSSFALVASRVAWSIFAAYIYRCDARKKMDKLRKLYSNDSDYSLALKNKGGVSLAAAIGIPVALSILASIVLYFSGLDLFAVNFYY